MEAIKKEIVPLSLQKDSDLLANELSMRR